MSNDIWNIPEIDAPEFAGFSDSSTAQSFQPGLFGDFARLAFPPPQKADMVLAHIGGVTDRAARAWMAGDAEAPSYVSAAVFLEIQRRCRRKRSL